MASTSSSAYSRLGSTKKKKSASANRRIRERSRLSFLFVIFFFGLFSLIIVMESLMADGNKNFPQDDEGEGDDYSSWDISYEENPPGNSASPTPSSPSSSHQRSTKSTRNNNNNFHNNNNNNDNNKKKSWSNVAKTISIPYSDSLRYQGPLVRQQTKQEALQHVDLQSSQAQDTQSTLRASSSFHQNGNSYNNSKTSITRRMAGSSSSISISSSINAIANSLHSSNNGKNNFIDKSPSKKNNVNDNLSRIGSRKGTGAEDAATAAAASSLSSSSSSSAYISSLSSVSASSSSSSSSSLRNLHPVQPDWQKVVGSKEKFYVYSAYYNTVFEHIRIIGATRTKTSQHVQCRFYDNTTKLYATVDGTVRTIRENWNLKYSACFIICYLPDRKVKPRYVSVMANASPNTAASNILRVQYSSEKSHQLVDFAACVKPIHFNYNNVLNFLEWMEFHKLMGVQRFTFFNHTIGKEVSCIMKEYGDEIEVLPWSLPFISQKEIRTEGLFAALNDCVYRHRGASKYLVLVDLDEMIVPRKTQNYSMFIEQLDTLSNKKKIGAYSLQNAFFYLQWPNDQSVFKIEGNPLAEQISRHLTMLKKTRRKSRLHPHKQRSKYICDPEKVIEAGNHFVWEMATGYFTLSTPPHLGTLHHYRVCEFGGDQCIKSPSTVDKSAHTFGQKLAIRVADMLQSVANKCQLDLRKILKSNDSETKPPVRIKA